MVYVYSYNILEKKNISDDVVTNEIIGIAEENTGRKEENQDEVEEMEKVVKNAREGMDARKQERRCSLCLT
ncbi:hypothetical protein OWV82_014072 [Melia azedarach]|uniref:Uncharacterized protein n=1 Tax=Melia azedarach TaxID=155640 RepID=A0ACC1XYE6_MELAZ|nr:hypothetical protein OWV82_014072 [Melia azedarach]